MIIGILAVLKAGGAYVPLDPLYTSERLLNILHDTAPVCLVADPVGRTALGEDALSFVTIADPDGVESYPATNPRASTLTSRHLAYVIYTSGTTGKPKGVMVEHQGVISLVTSRQKYLAVSSSSRMTQFFSVSFDPSLLEIFGTLGFGGALHVIQEATRLDRIQLWDYLVQNRITHAILTPTVLQDCGDLSPLSAMSTLLIGGEALSAALVRRVRKLVPNGTIINEYGPTETSVAALSWKYAEEELIGQDAAPIGRPFSNKRIYLLDRHGNQVPQGSIGEIYIGGLGVARGYLNRPDLTANVFLPDPFSSEDGARMYRTGDLAKYLPDGNIVCLGRNDHQVKIRGFRIELGEIEAGLVGHPLVTEAVVVAQGEAGNKRLVAYVIIRHDKQQEPDTSTGKSPSTIQMASSLHSHLTTRLPDYMVPAAFVCLEAFPVNSNGKLDLKALPAPDIDAFAVNAYEEPKGEIENILASVWAEMLKVERVGRNDSFFILGGHSLLAVRMMSRIRTMLGFDMSLRTLFEAPTIAELAPRLLATGATQEESYDILLPIRPQGTRPPLFCVHPGSGLSWCYTGLSTRLDPDQPLYGLQARGFIDNGEMASTLEEMVLDYIDQVRRIQPHGPYHLLGYSFGGAVAHAMASYLEEHGENVAFVALMDSFADYHTWVQQPDDKDEDEQRQDLIPMLIGNKEQYAPDLINPFLEKASTIENNNLRLLMMQVPQIISTDLLIFRATVLEKEGDRLLNPDDWKPHVLGSIETYDIDCAHNFMDLPKPTAIIGRVLSQKLDESHSRAQKEE
ncbi:hypothetical protein BC939DRAFT_505499 [Gamsiella multidivaricata]|uniref:uncharacterized protein n=1 Tax=Gamsiella multidivaricata TaxID=101098 RepID=UPI00221F0F57|nr:uncharacterized protein BC939DRAFT_505499 [Gamsiella multidivaricata]KAG0354081.1 hypothetical protein BGZ54_001859 [Gamsiella multidivaricata]KAI7819662.1 hypothetical protein BC939DRAFT_505499 [Gamsiella multidivaricata]